MSTQTGEIWVIAGEAGCHYCLPGTGLTMCGQSLKQMEDPAPALNIEQSVCAGCLRSYGRVLKRRAKLALEVIDVFVPYPIWHLKRYNPVVAQNPMRRFKLVRDEDVHDNTGTGDVAFGVEFWPDGPVSYLFNPTIEFPEPVFHNAPNAGVVERLHSHGNRTRLVWID